MATVLKQGDPVITYREGYLSFIRDIVVEVTESEIVTKHGFRFDKQTNRTREPELGIWGLTHRRIELDVDWYE